MPPDFVYKLILRITLNPSFQCLESLKAKILEVLKARVREIKGQYPGKRIRAFFWLSADDLEEMDFLLSQEFAAYQNSLVMKFDLAHDIPEVPKPEDIIVMNKKIDTEEERMQYHQAETAACQGIAWSMNLLRWYTGAPEWMNFLACDGEQLVGSTMTWMITEERSAIENIFVLPEYRRKGIAKYMIIETLEYQKRKGKSTATLSVHGDNKRAIALYRSLGFQMFGIMIEFGYQM